MSVKVQIGSIAIGDGCPIAIQSMTNTDTSDVAATTSQLLALEQAGCDIARIAFTSEKECRLIGAYKQAVSMPLVADIQFDYKIALAAMENGIDKVRINPGNIGDETRVKQVLDCAKAHHIPIRIGVNSGSLPKDVAARESDPAARLVQAALREVALCEKYGFDQLVLSVKSSSAAVTAKAYRLLAAQTSYPLHLGVTEAGAYSQSVVKTAVALGGLLLDGIGDTIRVSVTGDVLEEITAAIEILRAAGRLTDFCEIVSCPTCARTKINLPMLEKQVRDKYGALKRPLKIAVMGCAVNGPGEAADADFGIAGGDGKGIVFEKGKIVESVDESELFNRLCARIDNWLDKKK